MLTRNITFISGLALLLASTGCQRGPDSAAAVQEDSQPVTTESAAAAKKPVRVKTVAVQTQELRQTTTQPATVAALYRTQVKARVAGYLAEVHVDIGDAVKQGASLATLDVPELLERQAVLQAEIERQQAEEAKAKAGIDLAAASVQAAEAQFKEAEAQLQSVDASLAAADAEFNRTEDLVNRRSVEPRLLDEARKKRDSEAARKTALQSAVASAEASIAVAKARREAAKAELQSAQAETAVAEQRLKELDVQLQFAHLKAPFAGVITQRHAEPGELVAAGDSERALFEISRVDRVRIRVSVPERDAAYVNRDDLMRIRFPSFAKDETVEAKVTRTSGSLDPQTRMMLVEAEVDNKDGRLIPGLFGEAQIRLTVREHVALLPARAIRFTETGEAYVYAVTDGTVRKVDVTTGADDGSTIEIVSGIEAGQTVIDAHLQRFADGQRVEALH